LKPILLEYSIETNLLEYSIETNSIRVLRKGYILQSHIYFKESHIYFLKVLVSILLPKSWNMSLTLSTPQDSIILI